MVPSQLILQNGYITLLDATAPREALQVQFEMPLKNEDSMAVYKQLFGIRKKKQIVHEEEEEPICKKKSDAYESSSDESEEDFLASDEEGVSSDESVDLNEDSDDS